MADRVGAGIVLPWEVPSVARPAQQREKERERILKFLKFLKSRGNRRGLCPCLHMHSTALDARKGGIHMDGQVVRLHDWPFGYPSVNSRELN
jgi:hypothetical protein